MSYIEYSKIINNSELRNMIAKRILDDIFNNEAVRIDISELRELLKHINKSMF